VQRLDRLAPPPPPPPARRPQAHRPLLEPVYVASPPADSQRLFVVEQGGTIRVLHNDTAWTRPFLDLSGRIALVASAGC